MQNCILYVYFDGHGTMRFAPKNCFTLVDAKAWYETFVARLGSSDFFELLSVKVNGILYDL